MQSNKGRFKCPDEAQAVWNFFESQVYNFLNVRSFEAGSDNGVKALEAFANDLHQARLIHGTIYDEYGRIEDYAENQIELLLETEDDGWPSHAYFIKYMVRMGKIRGTIFY